MKQKITLFTAYFLLWLGLNWSADWENILAGTIAAAFVSFITADLFISPRKLSGSGAFLNVTLRRGYFILRYIILFTIEFIKTNTRAACEIIQPARPPQPQEIRIETSLKSDTGITLLANTLTMATAAITIDADKNSGVITAYINEYTEGKTGNTINNFEKIISGITE